MVWRCAAIATERNTANEPLPRIDERPAPGFGALGAGWSDCLAEVETVSKIRNAVRLPAKRSKYRAVRCEYDGVKFASKRERDRYTILAREQALGSISGLMLQPRFAIKVNDELICTYVGDFEYDRGPEHVVEDSKGVKTAVYRLKKKLMWAIHGIEIKEV